MHRFTWGCCAHTPALQWQWPRWHEHFFPIRSEAWMIGKSESTVYMDTKKGLILLWVYMHAELNDWLKPKIGIVHFSGKSSFIRPLPVSAILLFSVYFTPLPSPGLAPAIYSVCFAEVEQSTCAAAIMLDRIPTEVNMDTVGSDDGHQPVLSFRIILLSQRTGSESFNWRVYMKHL